MRIARLTVVASGISEAMGSGKYHITYQEIIRRIRDGTVFDFLSNEVDIMVPISILTPADKLELLIEWEDMIGCIGPFRQDTNNNGLCLLMGYLLEGIQRRASSSRYTLTEETPVQQPSPEMD